MTGDGPTIAIEGTREDWPRMTAIRGSNATVTDSLASLGPDDRLRLKQRTR